MHGEPSHQPVIEIDRLVKRYKGAENNAVNGISFTVASGSFFALLGPNGAGKTTTISILTTILAATSGTIRLAGYDIAHHPSSVRQEIGVIFQKPSLDQNLTAEENIRFHAVLYGLYPFRPTFSTMPRAYQERVRDLADVLDLGADLFKQVKTFSGGMKRKLEIVRSLIHRPRVLFLDEPTAGLDAVSRRALWEYIRQIQQSGATTVFLTTHYLEEAEGADTVCIINHGTIVSYGTPTEIKAHLIEEYIVVDAADRGALRSELERRKIDFVETPLFKLDLHGRTAHGVLKEIDTPLTVLQTHTPSLEDAYLAIVGNEDT